MAQLVQQRNLISLDLPEIGSLGTRLTAIFKQLDVNGNNLISRNELEAKGFSPGSTEYLLFSMDTNGDGMISFEEFYMYHIYVLGVFGKDRMNSTIESLEAIVAGECTSPKNTSVIPDVSMAAWYGDVMVRINNIFKRIDLNGNNRLEREEITKIYGGDARKADFMLHDVDVNHDGTISPVEFQAYFLNVLKVERKGNDWSHGMDRVSNMLCNLETLLERRDTSNA